MNSTDTHRPVRTRRAFVSAALLATLVGGGGTLAGQIVVAPTAQAAVVSSIAPGTNMYAGDTIASPDGRYTFEMQSDGNAVIYGPGHVAVWSTGTGGKPGAWLQNQTDGNIVIYAPGARPLWSAGTYQKAAATLVMQNDRNLVAYAAGGVATWSSGTNISAPPPVSSLRQRIVDVAQGEVGQPRSKEGAANCNYYSAQMGSGAGTCTINGYAGRTEAWCAQFVRWVFRTAGAQNQGLNAGARSVASYSTWRSGSALTGVQPGDVVGFRLFTGSAEDDHVGIVVAVNGNSITTVEGNTSTGVAKVTRTRGASIISGYASPVG